MTESLPFAPPLPEDYEMLRDAFYDLTVVGHTTLPSDTNPERFIYWLERYRGLDNVTIQELNHISLILAREI